MQWMAERRQRQLVEGFAESRVGVDGERDVLKPGAHLKRQRKGG